MSRGAWPMREIQGRTHPGAYHYLVAPVSAGADWIKRERAGRAGGEWRMARIVFLGGGVCGLSAGMLLARDGHEVTVLERDAAPVPESVEEAWEKWSRDGVTQFRLAHFLQPAGRAVLEEALPDVFEALVSAGAARVDLLGLMPPHLAEGGARAGDERFVTYTARRTTFEQVLGKA